MIVTSKDGMDEISTYSNTHVFEINKNQTKKYIVDPQDFGFKKFDKKEISGGTIIDNARIIKDILNGNKDPKRNLVVFNSAFDLYVAGLVTDIKEGIRLAEESIDSGQAKTVLQNLIRETQKYA
mgnify:FL=1